ncbi:MAG: DUF2380 domain-containing protein, partial [Methylocella sp.]
MKIGFPARRGRASFLSAGAFLFCGALLPAFDTSAETSPPVKLALFDFELEDFSAGGQLIGESPADTAQLKLATSEARRLIAQSGRYRL